MAILFNIIVSKNRWVVERTLGSIKRWFGSGKARYKGINSRACPVSYEDYGIICIVPLELLCAVHKNRYN
ncbi:MAG: transposase [Flavobacteriales bacterium Tduv]